MLTSDTNHSPGADSAFAGFHAELTSPWPEVVQKALWLARRLQERAAQLQTPPERRQQAELDRMLHHAQDKATLAQMTDQAFRPSSAPRAVDQFIHILDVQGIPRFFSPFQRTLLKGFQSFGGFAPGVAVPLVKERMRKETANVILPAEPELLLGHLRDRHHEGVRMNINFLGEAILGEEEAGHRLQMNLQGLQTPEVECISIKISTLYSQISALARDHTIATLCDRLELLYRTAAHLRFQRPDGSEMPKFVYLDMEEYRDMSLTAQAFMRTLDRPGLAQVRAGLVLQSYVPDSFRCQRELNEWARRRVAAGGAPITLRLVKGANLEAERFEASLKDWPQAPYQTKLETDANFKRMVQEGLKPENIAAVQLGIASHNLFDLAYALVLAAAAGQLDRVQFEMLEGMANPQRRALFELTRHLLLYAPVCQKESFLNAIGYLIRRLDENTGPENFLRYAFRIQPGGSDWQRLEKAFLDSLAAVDTVSDAPRRTQNRQLPPEPVNPIAQGWAQFKNEPDTDFGLPQNSDWAKQLITRWEPRYGASAAEIPLVIAGEEILTGRAVRDCLDPSRPGYVVGRFRQATESDIDLAVRWATADEDGWRKMTPPSRSELLGRVAQELRRARADLIGAALANGGKTIAESDPEVSEAVDFVEFYRDTARWWQELPTLKARPKGVVVVVSPWNFPIAIPCGGIVAALAAGNTVMLKPASDAVLVAWELCQCFWRAGVSKKALQFVPCSGGEAGRRLVAHPGVNAVILTGGTATALQMLRDKPSMHLCGETGGKNAIVVTAMADRDLAIKSVVHSAFSHVGQKCSAASLLLLEAEVYDDPKFKQALCDAVRSLAVGSAWELHNKIGPLIRPPAGDLENALKVLEPGESWAVLPHQAGDNPNLWSPGVKYGVQPGSYTHLTEFFGPVLGVMRFEKLAQAIEMVNQTGYGLTSGLQSLDDREQEQWKAGIRAGNLYINRTTVGAVVLRQPFGGMGKSAFGPGIKAGGPNYVAQFMDFTEAETPAVQETTFRSGVSAERRTLVGGAQTAALCRDAATPRFMASEQVRKEEVAFHEPPADSLLAGLCEKLRGLQPSDRSLSAADLERVLGAVSSFARSWSEEFGPSHDHFRLVGQDNFRRYLPVRALRIRVQPEDTPFDLFARVCAARTAGCGITVSSPPGPVAPALRLLEELTEFWAGAIEFVEETDDHLASIIREHQTDRLRYPALDRVPETVLRAAAETGLCIISQPVRAEGRLELLWYLQEQSISFDYHRYGNLGARASEARAPVQ
jgi:RHH-type transcriptional regulator, proline utilization regulon repressor / proline dehydrogenase / delta 1-pyrroline-5-carboxylate dehydrogenase